MVLVFEGGFFGPDCFTHYWLSQLNIHQIDQGSSSDNESRHGERTDVSNMSTSPYISRCDRTRVFYPPYKQCTSPNFSFDADGRRSPHFD